LAAQLAEARALHIADVQRCKALEITINQLRREKDNASNPMLEHATAENARLRADVLKLRQELAHAAEQNTMLAKELTDGTPFDEGTPAAILGEMIDALDTPEYSSASIDMMKSTYWMGFLTAQADALKRRLSELRKSA
jgi:hypothetical protein